MKLKHKKEVKIIVDESDFSDLIEEVYGQSYEFVADMEMNNSSQKSFNVKKGQFTGTLGKIYTINLGKFKQDGNYSYLAPHLLNDLADKGIIEEGNYLINVSW